MKLVAAAVVVAALGTFPACASDPEPPEPLQTTVSPAESKSIYDRWREERQTVIMHSVQTIGLWSLQEGVTAFGTDAKLPIALPSKAGPAKAGFFRRQGEFVVVVPEPGSPLTLENGTPVTEAMPMQTVMDESPTVLALGSIRMQVEQVFEKTSARRWVSAWDEDHSVVKNPPAVAAYDPDPRWRVPARFQAFDEPHALHLPDVRGGHIDLSAVGQLTFKLEGKDQKLTVIVFEGSDDFYLMFKDPTNSTTMYAGYRVLFTQGVAHNMTTVLDFNLAANPPCAYSSFTTCPLPPPENQITVAVEAGEKRYAGATGYVPKAAQD